MEKNTYTTSIYIAAPLRDVTAYLMRGDSLGEYTLFSRMKEQVDDTTWLGTASGYQAGLYYHMRHRVVGAIEIVEWHCGAEYGKYHHVYPMLVFGPEYWGSTELGIYYHWISFVDPARATQMITEGMPAVHSSESRSLKAQLERRAGHRAPVEGALALHSHTIYIEAPRQTVCDYLADPRHPTEWGYMLRSDGARIYDAYDREVEIVQTRHDLGEYELIEHDTRYLDTGGVVRRPILVVPSAYAFGSPAATGVIMHRISAWPTAGGRTEGKSAPGDYDTEAINSKRIIEARAGNLEAYARGCSYLASAKNR